VSGPSSSRSLFLTELEWRGLFAQASNGLEARLAKGPISVYNGLDPTAPSLHVGHLVPITVLTHLQRTGAGAPVALVGGGTGMIGDPSGKSAERNLLDAATLDANRAAIHTQLERLLDFSGGRFAARLLDNRAWLEQYSLIEFLRDIGKHFSLGYMLDKESVKTRLERGISFTEFAYMTLQAADFLHLYRNEGVEMQIGGTEQWGNMTAGLELIRRVVGRAEGEEPLAWVLAHPLLLNASGAKFGKTAGGAVWLSAELTSPYDFFQYWMNQDDRDVGTMLRWFTLLNAAEIEALEREQRTAPEARTAQRALAFAVTERVHGRAEAETQRRVAEAAFGDVPLRDVLALEALAAGDGFTWSDSDGRLDALGLALASGLVASRGEGRRLISQGGLSINDERVAAADAPLPEPIDGRFYVVRAGKRRVRVGRRLG
jgi:tyrosyl-tRNA synthetase